MNCKLGKLEIPADQPFLNCKLGREKYAEVLKAIITTYKKGFVLAIDGKWGTGKTTFVEMWKAYLELDNSTHYTLTLGKMTSFQILL